MFNQFQLDLVTVGSVLMLSLVLSAVWFPEDVDLEQYCYEEDYMPEVCADVQERK